MGEISYPELTLNYPNQLDFVELGAKPCAPTNYQNYQN